MSSLLAESWARTTKCAPPIQASERRRLPVGEDLEATVADEAEGDATGEGAMPALLDLRDIARDEQAWIRPLKLLGERALQYRLLMASIEMHAARCISHWPDDPDDNPDARRLGETDFRSILDEQQPKVDRQPH
jgi:hypothetical protein